ncbi:MAG: DNA/pantothenate metabolism flavoprotein, partial [Candidatus Altiarchaeales archaeon]|nr:DNA/pantothenate metabolism flavoprotein [Candidatus Altiarchaeales archaeon]
MKKIAVAVTGSVAAVKTPQLIRELEKKGFTVEAVLSEAARKIITPQVIHWACGRKPVTELTGELEHVKLCGLEGEADALLIYPATSNTISKIASGIDDTPVTTYAATALASGTKIIIAPAMHQSMYDNPYVAEN